MRTFIWNWTVQYRQIAEKLLRFLWKCEYFNLNLLKTVTFVWRESQNSDTDSFASRASIHYYLYLPLWPSYMAKINGIGFSSQTSVKIDDISCPTIQDFTYTLLQCVIPPNVKIFLKIFIFSFCNWFLVFLV